MRRLRASNACSHSGGAGAPPGVTRDPCQELADAMRRFRRMEAKRGPAPINRCQGQVPDCASLSGAVRREAAVRQQIVCADCVNLSAMPRSIKERP